MTKTHKDSTPAAAKTIVDGLVAVFGFAAGMLSVGGAVGAISAIQLKNSICPPCKF